LMANQRSSKHHFDRKKQEREGAKGEKRRSSRENEPETQIWKSDDLTGPKKNHAAPAGLINGLTSLGYPADTTAERDKK
ncbi:MAG: hypothetical protein VYB72_08915, partial [Planctomycetota bacterium]|nr:hypothetical protein [Planctomycetota bacterium]